MKISIITTIYKAEKDLPRLLDSMMEIKSLDIEFFLIDNGSPDHCYEICKRYADKDSRFTIYRLEENIGYIRARNLGIEKCNGDYIGFCDSDDYLYEGGYDKAISKIKETNCDFYIGAYKKIDKTKEMLIKSPFQEGLYDNEKIEQIAPYFFGCIEGKNRLNGFVWKNIYRREVILRNEIRFAEKLKPFEDQIFNVDVLRHCSSIYAHDNIMYNYIVNADSITAKMIQNFSFEAEYQRMLRLHFEYEKRIKMDKERIAESNYLLQMLYSIFLNAAKSKLSMKELKRNVLLSVDKQELQGLLKDSTKEYGQVMNFTRFCLRKSLFGMLIRCMRLMLRNKTE